MVTRYIKAGIYDNTRTMTRQMWNNPTGEDGRLLGAMSAVEIHEWGKRGLPIEKWGHYPEPPRVREEVAGQMARGGRGNREVT